MGQIMKNISEINYIKISFLFGFLLLSVIGCSDENKEQSVMIKGQNQPNILMIVVDDLGYTDLGAFGSEIATPNLDALANAGMMFTNYYVAPTCSPTRAMLLSGVDNHLAGMGTMYNEQSNNQKDIPGYEGYLNFQVAALPNILKDNGYHTYMTGKWHLGYDEETSPTARGFDRSYALLAGGAGHFSNMMSILGSNKAPYREDGVLIDSLPEDFYSTKFYTNKMIEYIDSNHSDDKPFFGYLAYTAPHWPLQAPMKSIQKHAGNYDAGYEILYKERMQKLKAMGLIDLDMPDSLSLPDDTPWNDLSDEEKKRSSRLMEIYAAMVSDLDHYVGNLIDHLKDIGQFENTFIFFMSDNGAEGHPLDKSFSEYGIANKLSSCCDHSYENMGNDNSYLWYGPEWARAGVGPWRRFKGFTSEGGIRAPAFAHYPALNNSTIKDSIIHVKDVMPTLLELAKIAHPGTIYKDREIIPMQGTSILPLLMNEVDYVHDQHYVEGWELFGKTAVRKGDWKIIQEPQGDFFSWQTPLADNYDWLLFNLKEDPSELNNLAKTQPKKMEEMLAAWQIYKEKNNVIIPESVMGF